MSAPGQLPPYPTHGSFTGGNTGNNPQGIIPLRPLRLGEILGGAVKAMRFNPAAMFGFSIVFAIIGQTVSAFGSYFANGYIDENSVMNGISAGNLPNFTAHEVIGFGAWVGATTILTLCVMQILSGLLTFTVSRAVIGQKIPASQAYSVGMKKAGGVVAVILLTFFVIIGVPGLVWMGVGAALTAGGGVVRGIGGAWLVIVGIAFIVWALVASVRLTFSAQAVVLEDAKPRTALRRSWQLSIGSFWRIVGITLVATVITSLIDSVLTTITTQIASPGTATISILTSTVATGIAGVVAGCFTQPFMCGVQTLLYTDLRMLNENLAAQLSMALPTPE